MDITTEAGALFDNHLRLKSSQAEEKQVSGLVSRYLLPPSSRYVDMWGRWLRRACPPQGARHQTGTAQVGDILQRAPTSGGRDRSSTSSAVILFCFTAYTLIPHASPSLQTGGGACEHPTAPFARPVVGTSASYRGGNRIRGAGRSERGRGRDWSRGG